jgi:hypothetical protein
MAEASETREGLGFPFPVVTSAAPPLAPAAPRGPPGGSTPGSRTIRGCGTGCVVWGGRGPGIGNGNGISGWVDGTAGGRKGDGAAAGWQGRACIALIDLAACFRPVLGLGWGWEW